MDGPVSSSCVAAAVKRADLWSERHHLTGSRERTLRVFELIMGLKTPLLAALLAALLATLEGTVVAAHRRGRSMPGSPYNISTSDRGLQRAVLSATCCFNNQSNDAFLFKPSTIHRAQRQIVKGIRYVVDFGISRTVCRKRDNNNNNNNLSSCEFQPAGRLQQTFQCHAELWLIPWKNQTRTQVLLCEP